MTKFEEQNKELFMAFLDRTWFEAWRRRSKGFKSAGETEFYLNYSRLEFVLNSDCDLACKYCYLNKHGDEYTLPKRVDPKIVEKNAYLILDWCEENHFYPELEMFGGEILSQDVSYKILDRIISMAENGRKITTTTTIPTNMNFLFSDTKTKQVKELIDRAAKVGIRLALSASVDGKFMEQNRPPRSKEKVRGDDFYDKLFKFAVDVKVGFHPMIYLEGIDKWKDNFLWFQNKFKEYDIPWQNIYLLEVRNKEWTSEQCNHLRDFIDFLVKWIFEMCGRSVQKFLNFTTHGAGSGFNILKSPFTTIGRGLGCSSQSSFALRLGDLTINPCHRLQYKSFDAMTFLVEDNKIVDTQVKNFAMMMMVNSCTFRTFPACEICLIKTMCSGGCLGSQFETTGDVFSPIPTVCRMEHAKITATLKAFNDIGALEICLNALDTEKRNSINIMLEEGLV